MRQILVLFCIGVLSMAFTCENEPLEGEFQEYNGNNNNTVTPALTCEEATEILAQASINYTNATVDNQVEMCLSYRSALEDYLETCGDPSGTIAITLDALGNCGYEGPADCDEAVALASVAAQAYENSDATNEVELCQEYKEALQHQITLCGDEDGSLQAAIELLGDCGSTVEEPQDCIQAIQQAMVAEEAFNNSNEENFTTLLQAYQEALQAQLYWCGLGDGSVQIKLTCLQDCESMEDYNCNLAAYYAQLAQIEYNNVDETNEDANMAACLAYKEALTNQLAVCGDDAENTLQGMIDALGDCSGEEQGQGVVSFSIAEEEYVFTFLQVSDESGQKTISSAEASNGVSFQFTITGGLTGMNKIESFEILYSDENTYQMDVTEFEPYYSDEITVNNADQLIGTFGGSFSNADVPSNFVVEMGQIEITF
ncbi:hypothetical protein [Mangrovimonas aestuarii]|uniref:hypothetical protein n=1 Tax=Mangrovimonas aestuarii TaxID=3018443 RepID=UPI0023794A3A|nr:hypothetical protein [Mangrovimonas aestuarii]